MSETKMTSKILRKRKTNLIISIVCLSIIGLLILTTILLAVIPVNAGARYTNAPDHIYLKYGSTIYEVEKDDEVTGADYEAIWNAYLSASNPTVMDTIFGGYVGQGMTANYSPRNSKSFANLATDTTFSVCFFWNESQTMINPDGSQFTYTIGDATINSPTKFYEAYFAVSDTNAVQENTIYLRTNTTSRTTNFTYTGVANFYGLYNILLNMVDDGKFVTTS